MGHLHDAGVGTGIHAETLPAAALPVLLAAGYLYLAARARRRNPAQGWSRWRTALFLTGCALLGLALLPPIASLAHDDFRGHILQHLLIGMYAPLALVLGAPITLLLRTLPRSRARQLSTLLRSRPGRLIANPATAVLLSTGTLAVLYFSPLYNMTMNQSPLHWLMHTHFLLSGYLFAWVIAGPDPAPRRPSVPTRLAVLGVAVAAHATVSQLVYGGFLININAPIDEVRTGAEIMYYGGDIAELLLAAALVASWRPTRHPRTTAPAQGRQPVDVSA
jgi:putative membrane protein